MVSLEMTILIHGAKYGIERVACLPASSHWFHLGGLLVCTTKTCFNIAECKIGWLKSNIPSILGFDGRRGYLLPTVTDYGSTIAC